MAAADLKAVRDEYPYRESPLAVTFTEEIRRISVEKGIEIKTVMEKLSHFSGISESQLYNYRMGKTPIPGDLIPVLCRQFESNALAMTILSMCSETHFEERDAIDLTRFCSQTVREMLQGGEEFMDAFEDGRIDGHELTRLNHTTAQIRRNANRLLEVARAARNRGRGSAPAAA